MKRQIIIMALLVLLAFPVRAAVEVKSSGDRVGTAVYLDFEGPAVTKSGGRVIVDTTDITGDVDITGTATTSGIITSGGQVTAPSFHATTSVNWTDATIVESGASINWDNVTLFGSTGINWQDTTWVGQGTVANIVATTADINGGTVDGATVGANSASTGKFTTVQATTSANLSDTAINESGATINWSNASMLGSTDINWQDTKMAGSGVNWASLDFEASSGINWTDVYNFAPAGTGSAKTACIREDGSIYGISAGSCF